MTENISSTNINGIESINGMLCTILVCIFLEAASYLQINILPTSYIFVFYVTGGSQKFL